MPHKTTGRELTDTIPTSEPHFQCTHHHLPLLKVDWKELQEQRLDRCYERNIGGRSRPQFRTKFVDFGQIQWSVLPNVSDPQFGNEHSLSYLGNTYSLDSDYDDDECFTEEGCYEEPF